MGVNDVGSGSYNKTTGQWTYTTNSNATNTTNTGSGSNAGYASTSNNNAGNSNTSGKSQATSAAAQSALSSITAAAAYPSTDTFSRYVAAYENGLSQLGSGQDPSVYEDTLNGRIFGSNLPSAQKQLAEDAVYWAKQNQSAIDQVFTAYSNNVLGLWSGSTSIAGVTDTQVAQDTMTALEYDELTDPTNTSQATQDYVRGLLLFGETDAEDGSSHGNGLKGLNEFNTMLQQNTSSAAFLSPSMQADIANTVTQANQDVANTVGNSFANVTLAVAGVVVAPLGLLQLAGWAADKHDQSAGSTNTAGDPNLATNILYAGGHAYNYFESAFKNWFSGLAGNAVPPPLDFSDGD